MFKKFLDDLRDLVDNYSDAVGSVNNNNNNKADNTVGGYRYSTKITTKEDLDDLKKELEEKREEEEKDYKYRLNALTAYYKDKKKISDLEKKQAEAEAKGDFGKAAKYEKEINRLKRGMVGKNVFTETVKGLEQIYNSVNKIIEPWAKADAAASKFAKTIGGTKASMDAMRSQMIGNVATGFGIKYNISTEELAKAQQDYIKGIGRNLSIDDKSQESIAAIARISADAGIDGLSMAAQFENFGVSISKTGDHLGKMFADASKSGIAFNKYAENVTKNIRIAQNYTFKDGLKGLENMAKKATAMKMDMQQVANFAEKVSTVEGAIETSARLQVLGGPFALMADPLGMLSESWNDMESFQDRQMRLFSQFGRFNKQTGQIDISTFDKQRLKAYAEATGQDFSSVMESVHTGAKRTEIERQMSGSAAASKFDDNMKELIRNTASFENGKVGIKIGDKFKTLDQLDPQKDRKYLEQMTKSESEDIKQIAQDLRSIKDYQEGAKKQAEGVMGAIVAPVGMIVKGVFGILSAIGGITAILVAIKTMQAMGGISNLIGGFKNPLKLLKGTTTGSGNMIGSRAFGWLGNTGRTAWGGLKTAGRATMGGLKTVGQATMGGLKTVGRATMSGLKTAGRATMSGLSSAGKFGLKALKGGGLAGAGLGIAGMIGNHYTDKAIAEGKMTAGGTGHHLAKAGSQALTYGGTGMAIGSLFGPVGTAIGAAVGGAIGAGVGLYQANKAKHKKVVEEQLAQKGIQMKGDYSRGELKDIDKALQTGKISDGLRRTLIASGDMAIVNEIQNKKEELDIKKENKDSKQFEIKSANIAISKANFGASILDFSVGKNNDIYSWTNPIGLIKKTYDYFNKDNINIKKESPQNIKPIKEKGLRNDWEPVEQSAIEKSKLKTQTEIGTNGLKSIDININGSLKLVGDKNQTIDIINELRKNDNLKAELAKIIEVELGKLNDGTNRKRGNTIMVS